MRDTTTSLGDLARETPSATRVFLRHKLDFCCGGKKSLADACTAAGLDPSAILAELDAEARRGAPSARWDTRPLADLADHIEAHYHAALRRDLPPLVEAAARVERVHRGKPEVPVGLADALTAFEAEISQHMRKEESILFPLIRRGARGEAVYMPVRVMESEHDGHSDRLREIHALTGDLQIPAHACATWRALYHGLETIDTELREHIHLENNILFERAARG